MSKNKDKKKEPKPKFQQNGTFTIELSDRKSKKALIYSIKEDAVHIRNMVLMVREELYTQSKTCEKTKEINDLFLSKSILRETVYGRKGNENSEKSKIEKKKIEKLRGFFKKHKLFQELCKFSQQKIDPKNFISILTEIDSNFTNFRTHFNKYIENKTKYAIEMGNNGVPNIPKQKKLSRINNASLMLDRDMWSLKKETKKVKKTIETTNKKGILVQKTKQVKEIHYYIRVKVGRFTQKLPINWTKFKYPKDQILKNLNLSHSNGSLYLHFGYGVIINPNKPKEMSIIKKKTKKVAGGDLGLINLLSVFVNDKKSASFMISGKRFIKYNCDFNKRIAKLNTDIAKEAIRWKEIETTLKDENGDNYLKNNKPIKQMTKTPTEYSKKGIELKGFKAVLTEKRNRFFKDEFEKISTHLVQYFEKIKVTDFVSSKNLSFAKVKGSINMNKKTKQKFYQIPFGDFLNMLERKLKLSNINFINIDEAHTSKTSCLSKNVNEMVKLREESQKSLSTNVYGGRRVKRGFYKDFASNVLFNADINGAVNHLKVAFKRMKFEWLLECKDKICSPILFKSDEMFRQQLLS